MSPLLSPYHAPPITPHPRCLSSSVCAFAKRFTAVTLVFIKPMNTDANINEQFPPLCVYSPSVFLFSSYDLITACYPMLCLSACLCISFRGLYPTSDCITISTGDYPLLPLTSCFLLTCRHNSSLAVKNSPDMMLALGINPMKTKLRACMY